METLRFARLFPGLPLLLLLLLSTGCEFEAPLSAKPEAPVDERLPGRWVAPNGWAKVSRYDAENYIVVYNGTVYRAGTVAGRDRIFCPCAT